MSMKKFITLSIMLLFIANLSIAQSNKISIEDIWLKFKFYPKTISGFNSMNNGEYYTVIDHGNLDQYSYRTGKLVKTLIDAGDMIALGTGKPSGCGAKEKDQQNTGPPAQDRGDADACPVGRHEHASDRRGHGCAKKATNASTHGTPSFGRTQLAGHAGANQRGGPGQRRQIRWVKGGFVGVVPSEYQGDFDNNGLENTGKTQGFQG